MKTKKPGFLIILILLQAVISLSFLSKDDFFSIIVLPDTQHYSSTYPEIFYKQMDWVVENKNLLNIQYVIHLGDITKDRKSVV